MAELFSMFFGPLDKSACNYFFFISVLFLIGFIILLSNEIIFIIQNFRNINFRMISNGFLILFNIFLAYFTNRLFYNMCTKSLA